MLIISLTPYAVLIGLFAVVYRHILAYEDILNWWFRFGGNYERRWFWKPIWGCELCIAGQLALWTYLINWISVVILGSFPSVRHLLFSVVPLYHLENYSLLELFIFITESIASAFTIYKLYLKLKQWQQNSNG